MGAGFGERGFPGDLAGGGVEGVKVRIVGEGEVDGAVGIDDGGGVDGGIIEFVGPFYVGGVGVEGEEGGVELVGEIDGVVGAEGGGGENG